MFNSRKRKASAVGTSTNPIQPRRLPEHQTLTIKALKGKTVHLGAPKHGKPDQEVQDQDKQPPTRPKEEDHHNNKAVVLGDTS